jgi:Protein of unknown function (DUF5818)
MKRSIASACGLLMLFILNVSFAKAQEKAYTGEIMDSSCAKDGSHAMMLKKEGMGNMDPNDVKAKQMCTENCVKKMGAKYVLFSAPKTVYQLDDQSKPAGFAGQKVTVTGTYDKSTKTIHVADIKAAS